MDKVPHVEKSIPDETTNAGLSSEDQAFLDSFSTERAAKIYRKVSLSNSYSPRLSLTMTLARLAPCPCFDHPLPPSHYRQSQHRYAATDAPLERIF